MPLVARCYLGSHASISSFLCFTSPLGTPISFSFFFSLLLFFSIYSFIFAPDAKKTKVGGKWVQVDISMSSHIGNLACMQAAPHIYLNDLPRNLAGRRICLFFFLSFCEISMLSSFLTPRPPIRHRSKWTMDVNKGRKHLDPKISCPALISILPPQHQVERETR